MFQNLHFVMRKIGAGLALLTIAGSYLYAQQWEDVGGAQGVSAGGSSYNNLVVDQTGNYYLSYYDTSVSKGSVQKFNGNSWSYVGGSPGITEGTATFNSLSLDGTGNIFYTHQVGYPGTGIAVHQFNGISWSQLPKATESSANYHASAVSPSNTLFTFGGQNSGTVQRFVNGAWEQVGNTGFSNGASFAELVIGTNERVYTCNVSAGVRVYQNSTSAASTDTWTLVGGSIVDAASSSEQYTSDIAIDGNNNLYVAYVSSSANEQKLNVKKFDGTAWIQVGQANFSSGRVQHVAITVTKAGQPYVVASRFENDNLFRNTAYKFDAATQNWITLGGDFISAGEAKFNDLAIDRTNNYLVLAYSEDVTRVKRIPLDGVPPGCTNTDPGSNPGDTGCVTFTYQGQQVTYATVRGGDGNIWLQQNLGSSGVATSLGDDTSYGDLFQWGRWDDGHQLRNSATAAPTSPNSPDGLAGSNAFIIGSASWWDVFASTDKWTATSPANISGTVGADPCRALGQGWKMPSQAEWAGIVSSENIANPGTAYNSRLKLPASGYRSSSSGALTFTGQRGYFWSSDTSGLGGKYLYIGSTIANPSAGAMRGQGSAVRCIKTASALGTSDIIRNTETTSIYPNPTSGIVNVKSDSLIESISVINMVGQRLNNMQFSNNQINMNGLPNGIYIVELKLKNGQIFSKKLIKN
ncbi:T9SS type A sorting domain-containing protein [Chryseobacterium sp. L7]|uniref:T9SS type A sorting domain-containing protein n=1 Tax=Chryseobacterium endalhagicum TaxID=2797638 RepID=A0ABS1QFN9_9FLAO|nr:T9SS type A sorting domain-containing protein [Chryseobacterium endalhagicum]MBL1221403.1 T9SS type A sorting domain-containing protein [Chryseobacterium endalhagicum]